MNVVFENEHAVVVDKPAGWLSVPSRMGEQDARSVVGIYLQEKLSTQIFPVHRLDFEVSGVMIFAKTKEAHKILNQCFEQKKVQKKYSAQTEGVAPLEKNFLWKSKILRGKKRTFESPHGQESITKALFVGEKNQQLDWIIEPVTGRSHQIRFELAKHGYPIVGDKLYGSSIELKSELTADIIALRAFELSFLDTELIKALALPQKICVSI